MIIILEDNSESTSFLHDFLNCSEGFSVDVEGGCKLGEISLSKSKLVVSPKEEFVNDHGSIRRSKVFNSYSRGGISESDVLKLYKEYVNDVEYGVMSAYKQVGTIEGFGESVPVKKQIYFFGKLAKRGNDIHRSVINDKLDHLFELCNKKNKNFFDFNDKYGKSNIVFVTLTMGERVCLNSDCEKIKGGLTPHFSKKKDSCPYCGSGSFYDINPFESWSRIGSDFSKYMDKVRKKIGWYGVRKYVKQQGCTSIKEFRKKHGEKIKELNKKFDVDMDVKKEVDGEIKKLYDRYSNIPIFRVWESTERFNPHIHLLMVFPDLKFKFKRHLHKDGEIGHILVDKEVKDILTDTWHSFVKILGVRNLKNGLCEISKYITKNLDVEDEVEDSKYDKTNSMIWVHRKQGYHISRRKPFEWVTDENGDGKLQEVTYKKREQIGGGEGQLSFIQVDTHEKVPVEKLYKKDFVGAIWGEQVWKNLYSEFEDGLGDIGENYSINGVMQDSEVKWNFLGILPKRYLNFKENRWFFKLKDPPQVLIDLIKAEYERWRSMH